MRLLRGLLVAAGVLAASANVAADELGAADAGAIRGIIAAQLDAFRRDDGERAFSFASPGIRAMFRDPETFMRMVRGGYRPVYRPREVEFRSLGLEDGRWTQRVLLVGPDGMPVIARYIMERQPDGSWRIDGCVLEPVPEVTA